MYTTSLLHTLSSRNLTTLKGAYKSIYIEVINTKKKYCMNKSVGAKFLKAKVPNFFLEFLISVFVVRSFKHVV
jgi:hypothetical protein